MLGSSAGTATLRSSGWIALGRWSWVGGMLVAVGCAESKPPTYPTSGVVTLNGAPVEEGTITFLPTEGTPGNNVAATITAGAFSAPQEAGLCIGGYRVEIDAYRKTGRKIRDLASPDRRLAEPPLVEERVSIIPPQYNTQSELRVQVTGPADIAQLNFALRD